MFALVQSGLPCSVCSESLYLTGRAWARTLTRHLRERTSAVEAGRGMQAFQCQRKVSQCQPKRGRVTCPRGYADKPGGFHVGGSDDAARPGTPGPRPPHDACAHSHAGTLNRLRRSRSVLSLAHCRHLNTQPDGERHRGLAQLAQRGRQFVAWQAGRDGNKRAKVGATAAPCRPCSGHSAAYSCLPPRG
jgi:hypothetical protein